MRTLGSARSALRMVTALVLAFMYFPLALIVVYAFNASGTSGMAARRASRSDWFARRSTNTGSARRSLTSLAGGARRDARSPWCSGHCVDRRPALPVLRPRGDLVRRRPPDRPAGHRDRHRAAARHSRRSASTSACSTIVVGHATFCVVLVYNNVDRPAAADTARRPRRRRPTSARTRGRRSGGSRCRASGRRCSPERLLAFALSFDEIIVTNFTSRAGTRRCRSGSSRASSVADQVALVNVAGSSSILPLGHPGLPRDAVSARVASPAPGPDPGASTSDARGHRRGRSRRAAGRRGTDGCAAT